MAYDEIAVARRQALNDLRTQITRKYARLREAEFAREYERFNAEWDARINAGEVPVADTLQRAAARELKELGSGE